MPSNRDYQTVMIGNAYELLANGVQRIETLSELYRVDERHFSLKCAYWKSRFGWADVAICRSSKLASEHLRDLHNVFLVCPKQATTSVCRDLLDDQVQMFRFLEALDRDRRVVFCSYGLSAPLLELMEVVKGLNYDCSLEFGEITLEICEELNNKVYVERELFQKDPELSRHRPYLAVANTIDCLWEKLHSVVSERKVCDVVVKSARSVGGAGVFFLSASDLFGRQDRFGLFQATGYNEADTRAPFVVERFIDWRLSPTSDLFIDENGECRLLHVSLQRLFDRKYYAGFYKPKRDYLEHQDWYQDLRRLALRVGRRAAALGYRGFLNVDFVVDKEGQVHLMELNARRSALMDGLNLAEFLCDGLEDTSLSVADYVEMPKGLTWQRLVLLANHYSTKFQCRVRFTLSGGFSSGYRWLGLWVCSETDSESAFECLLFELLGETLQIGDIGSIGNL